MFLTFIKVDGSTIKKLDANLFRGQEIKEVYEEILKTLPTDHMTFDMVSCFALN